MELNLLQIANSFAAIQRLCSEKASAKTAYTLKRNFNQPEREMKQYDEQRVELAKKYGTLDKTKQQYVFDDEQGKKFADEMNELLAIRVSLDLRTFPVQNFELPISTVDMIALEWMFTDEIESPK